MLERQVKRIASIVVVVLFCAPRTILCTLNAGDENGTVPRQVVTLVVPILDAMEKANHSPRPHGEEEGTPLWTVGVLVGKLIRQKSRASDEALVILLYYYLGESNGEDQFREIIARGKKMLPYLRKYQSRAPRIDDKNYDDVLLPLETVKELFRDAVDFINKGETAQQ